ncbi:MAG TPA: hypothetical protein VII38_06720 [Polyangia bacterium]|jgi:hypothetical protein
MSTEPFAAFELAELRLVYRALHAHILEHPALIDSSFLFALQKFLQARATGEGVELADHAAWDAWLSA